MMINNVKFGGIQANLGADGSSSVEFGPGGVTAQVGGLGVSIGKKLGFSTPIGGLSIDFEEAGACNQQ